MECILLHQAVHILLYRSFGVEGMSLLKQIDDKGAVIEWSPISSNPNMVALGTKDSAGSGFDDYGGDLEIHKLNFQEKGTSSTIIGKAKSK